MKKIIFPIFLLMVVLLLNGCSSAKKVAYFQNIDTLSLAASAGLYDAHIMPKDELTITVVTSDPEASRPFNLSVQNTLGNGGNLSSGSGALLTYLVDNSGNIDFPVVGKLHVAGMTKTESEKHIG